MKPIPSFEDFMTALTPVLLQLEKQRQELKKDVLRKTSYFAAAFFILAVIGCFFMDDLSLLLVAALLSLIFLFFFNNMRTASLCSIYKEKVISQVVNELVENGKYEPTGGIGYNVFNETGLYVNPDRYNSEDLISGTIDKTTFRFAEVHAEEKRITHNGKSTRTSWETIFKGFIFIADFHKNFYGHTIVARDSFIKLRRGRVKLENPEFEKHFDVFSSDQVEARYLLTPSMMEKIVDLDKKWGNEIQISFCNSNIVIAIPDSDNHFESGLWSRINNTDILKKEYTLITKLTAMVNELNLNTRIWSKQ